jgi:predicted dehydrogenase
MSSKTKVGMIGCGNISSIYCQANQKFRNLEIVACSDMDMARAQARAEEFKIPKACTVEQLLASPDVEIVLNITIPAAHAEVALAALNAGKHVYGEKPLASVRADGEKIIKLAKSKNLRVGCAPDTFLGGGIQTCRKLIDDGWIGEPIGATAFMTTHGPEHWHPDPNWVYQPGGGPLFDMGPYYLTALAFLIGPIKRVGCAARITFPERMITSQPKYGQMIKVNTPTHVSGILEFQSGAIGTMIMSLDVWAADLPRIEIYGTEGTLSVPDPNTFGGPVRVKRGRAQAWSEVPLMHGYAEQSRGVGLADMAQALVSNRPHRASGELSYHVLDAMQSLLDASESKRFVELSSTCTKPKPFPTGLLDGTIDP